MVLWLRPDVFTRPTWAADVQRALPLASFSCFHLNYSWSHPHCTVLYTEEDLIRYLASKVCDQIAVQKVAFTGGGGRLSRLVEGVAVCGNSIGHGWIRMLRALPMLWVPKRCEARWNREMSCDQIRGAAESTWWHIPASLYKTLLHDTPMLIGIPSVLDVAHYGPNWPHTVRVPVDYKEEEGEGGVVTLQKNEPVVWGGLPLGELIETTLLVTKPLSSHDVKIVEPSDHNYTPTRAWCECMLWTGDSLDPLSARQNLRQHDQAVVAWAEPISDRLFSAKDVSRFLPLVNSRLESLRKSVVSLEGETRLRVLSFDHITRAVLFKDSPTISGGTVLPPLLDATTGKAPAQKVNNSTIKEVNLVLTMLGLRAPRNFAKDDIPEIVRGAAFHLLLLGSIVGDTTRILKKLFPQIQVSGVGLESTLSGGVRSNVFEAMTRHVAGDILISDIDQTGFDSTEAGYDGMRAMTVQILEVALRMAPWGALKVNFPYPHLLNALASAYREARPGKFYYLYQGHGQNTLTSEVYFIYSPVVGDGGWFTNMHPCVQQVLRYEAEEETSCLMSHTVLSRVPDKNAHNDVVSLIDMPCTLLAFQVPLVQAREALVRTLAISDRVLTWRRSGDVASVSMLARVERSRMGLCVRHNGYFDFMATGDSLGYQSFGVSDKPQSVSMLSVQPWATVVNYAVRYRCQLLLQVVMARDNVVIVGARDLGEVCEAYTRGVVVCDDYPSTFGGVEKYVLEVRDRFWDFLEGPYEDETMYWFNFVTMAPVDGVSPTVDEQMAKIRDSVQGLKRDGTNAVFVFSIYLDQPFRLCPFADFLPQWHDCLVSVLDGRYSLKIGSCGDSATI